MTQTLPHVSIEHHERLMHHVDLMPATGDLILATPPAELRPHIDELSGFLTGLLIPHMDAAERTFYPELERLMQNRHSMTPMRREHGEIRQLVADVVRLQQGLDEGRLHKGGAVELHRLIFRLYALLKVHLAVEQLYLEIVEHGLSAESTDALAAAMEHAGTKEF
jgi:hypothetical protein